MRRRTGNFLVALVIAMGLSTLAASDATAGGKRYGAANYRHHGGEHNHHGYYYGLHRGHDGHHFRTDHRGGGYRGSYGWNGYSRHHGDHVAPYGWLWGVAARGGHHR